MRYNYVTWMTNAIEQEQKEWSQEEGEPEVDSDGCFYTSTPFLINRWNYFSRGFLYMDRWKESDILFYKISDKSLSWYSHRVIHFGYNRLLVSLSMLGNQTK